MGNLALRVSVISRLRGRWKLGMPQGLWLTPGKEGLQTQWPILGGGRLRDSYDGEGDQACHMGDGNQETHKGEVNQEGRWTFHEGEAACGGGGKAAHGEGGNRQFCSGWAIGWSHSGEKWLLDSSHLGEGLLQNLPLLHSMQETVLGSNKNSSKASKIACVRFLLLIIFLKKKRT